MKTLDLDAVQTFVLVADLKSFTRAAEAMETTQSAVSLKVKRLETGLGRRLLERTPRLVRLSAEGGVFLERARTLLAAHRGALDVFDASPHRLTVGISDHLVGADLPSLLKRLGNAEPGLVLEMRVGSSVDIVADFDHGTLDAAIVLRHENRGREGEVVRDEPFAWMATPDFEHSAGRPLRLATQSEPCIVRGMAVAALDAAGIAWTEVFVGGGVATTGAAVSAGLAVAALARRVAPAGLIDIGPRLGLPPLGSRAMILYSSLSDPRTRNALRALVAAFRAGGP